MSFWRTCSCTCGDVCGVGGYPTAEFCGSGLSSECPSTLLASVTLQEHTKVTYYDVSNGDCGCVENTRPAVTGEVTIEQYASPYKCYYEGTGLISGTWYEQINCLGPPHEPTIATLTYTEMYIRLVPTTVPLAGWVYKALTSPCYNHATDPPTPRCDPAICSGIMAYILTRYDYSYADVTGSSSFTHSASWFNNCKPAPCSSNIVSCYNAYTNRQPDDKACLWKCPSFGDTCLDDPTNPTGWATGLQCIFSSGSPFTRSNTDWDFLATIS